MAAGEPFGPFRPECDPVERRAQLRCLRTLVHIHWTFDVPAVVVEAALLHAEAAPLDRIAVAAALRCFDTLPALTRRRILSTFAYIHKPLYNSPRTQPKKGTANAYVE